MEDAGSAEVIEALAENFSIESFSSRYVSLNQLTFMYYLSRDCDLEGYKYAAAIIDLFYRFLKGVYPDRGEYVTLMGRKPALERSQGTGEPGPATPEPDQTRVP